MSKPLDQQSFKEQRDFFYARLEKLEEDPFQLVGDKGLDAAREATSIEDENVLKVVCHLAQSWKVNQTADEFYKGAPKIAPQVLKAIELVTSFMCCSPEESNNDFVNQCLERQKKNHGSLLPRVIVSKAALPLTKISTVEELKRLHSIVEAEVEMSKIGRPSHQNTNLFKELLDDSFIKANIKLSKSNGSQYWNAIKFIFNTSPRNIIWPSNNP